MKKIVLFNTLLLLCTYAGQTLASDYEVGQSNKNFTVAKLKVNVGDTVKFTNEDPFYHNIYSLSEIKSFDLGSFRKGRSRSVTFDKAGKVEIECAIHPNMKMVVIVK